MVDLLLVEPAAHLEPVLLVDFLQKIIEDLLVELAHLFDVGHAFAFCEPVVHRPIIISTQKAIPIYSLNIQTRTNL